MTRAKVAEKVLEIVREQLGDDEISESYKFGGPGDDSLDNAEIVMEVEDTFELTIPDSDVANLKTVGDTIEYVFKKLNPGK